MSYADIGLSHMRRDCPREPQPARFAVGSRRGHFGFVTNLVGCDPDIPSRVGAVMTAELSFPERIRNEYMKIVHGLDEKTGGKGHLVMAALGLAATVVGLQATGAVDFGEISDKIFGEGKHHRK